MYSFSHIYLVKHLSTYNWSSSWNQNIYTVRLHMDLRMDKLTKFSIFLYSIHMFVRLWCINTEETGSGHHLWIVWCTILAKKSRLCRLHHKDLEFTRSHQTSSVILFYLCVRLCFSSTHVFVLIIHQNVIKQNKQQNVLISLSISILTVASNILNSSARSLDGI